MSDYDLYEAIENQLNNETYSNIQYENMDEDKVGSVGIYLYQSRSDERTLDDVAFMCIKVQVQVNAEQSASGIKKAIEYLSEFADKIEECNSNSDTVEFIDAMYSGHKVLPIGKNKFNIPVYRTVIDLKYIFTSQN